MKKYDSAILIFIITAFGYACTFIFEWGFLSFYNLPFTLVDINISTIIRNILFFIGTLGFGFIISSFFIESDIRKSNFVKKIINKKDTLNKKEFFLGQFLAIISQVTFIVLFSQYMSYTYLLLALSSALIYFIMKDYIILTNLFLVIFLLVFVFTTGYSFAKNKKEYFIIDETDQLVIYHSQERAIVARFDEDKNTIHSEYQFVNLDISDIGKYVLKLVYIKELNVEK